MPSKPTVSIVGTGNLGSALALALGEAGYPIKELIARQDAASLARARKVAALVSRKTNGEPRVSSIRTPLLNADLIWLCVPDREIEPCAAALAQASNWNGKLIFHCSGALTSAELSALKKRGGAVASIHPLMTFVRSVRPSLKGVPFAVEGDAIAVRVARRIVHDLGGLPFALAKQYKPAYHAWGGFTSPLLVALLVAGEQVAMQAGLSASLARRRMRNIVEQTLANYFAKGPAEAFSGPIVRGDTATVQKHLKVLSGLPEVKELYRALARSALQYLPGKNKRELSRVLLD